MRYTPINPALKRLRQEDHEFKVYLSQKQSNQNLFFWILLREGVTFCYIPVPGTRYALNWEEGKDTLGKQS
jgi:hypothetical protein